MTIDIPVKGTRRFGKGGNARIISRAPGTPFDPSATQIICSAGTAFAIADDLADSAVIATLSLDGDPLGNWAIEAGSWSKAKLVGTVSDPTIQLAIDDADGLDSGDQGEKTVTISNGGELDEPLTITVFASSEPVWQTSLLVTNTDSGGAESGPVIFGMPLPAGVFGASNLLSISGAEAAQEDNRCTDRNDDVRFLSCVAWVDSLAASSTVELTASVGTGSPSSGASLTIAQLLTLFSDWEQTITVDLDGTDYTVDLRSVLSTGTSTPTQTGPVVRATKWRDGPVCKEFVIHSPLYDGETPHDDLHVHATVAFFSGDNFTTAGFVRVHAEVANDFYEADDGDYVEHSAGGSIEIGLASPAEVSSLPIEDLTGTTVTISAGPHSKFRTLTRASGVWPDHIVGSTIIDSGAGFCGFVSDRISDTVIYTGNRAGEGLSSLTAAKVYPLPLWPGTRWVSETWWPSQPTLRVQHSFAGLHSAKMLYPYARRGATAIADNQAALDLITGTGPFWARRSGGTYLLGEEEQTNQAEGFDITREYYNALMANDGNWLSTTAYDRVIANARHNMALRKRISDSATLLPIDIDDHSMRKYELPSNSAYPDLALLGNKGSAWTNDHQYQPYLLTGDYIYLAAQFRDFTHFWSNNYQSLSDEGSTRLMLDATGVALRSRAWTDRTSSLLIGMIPDSAGDLVPMTKARMRTLLDLNFAHLVSRYIDNGSGDTGWSSESPAGPNLNASDDPLYLINSADAEFHPWQQDYWARVSLIRWMLGENNEDSTAFYTRLHQSVLYRIAHEDILAKSGGEDVTRNRMFGTFSTSSTSSGWRQSLGSSPFLGFSGIYDEATNNTTNYSYKASHAGGIQVGQIAGYYSNPTDVDPAMEWMWGFIADFGDITLNGTDPDYADWASWNVNRTQRHVYWPWDEWS